MQRSSLRDRAATGTHGAVTPTTAHFIALRAPLSATRETLTATCEPLTRTRETVTPTFEPLTPTCETVTSTHESLTRTEHRRKHGPLVRGRLCQSLAYAGNLEAIGMLMHCRLPLHTSVVEAINTKNQSPEANGRRLPRRCVLRSEDPRRLPRKFLKNRTIQIASRPGTRPTRGAAVKE